MHLDSPLVEVMPCIEEVIVCQDARGEEHPEDEVFFAYLGGMPHAIIVASMVIMREMQMPLVEVELDNSATMLALMMEDMPKEEAWIETSQVVTYLPWSMS